LKSISYHIAIILVVFLGIFLGTLPDLWPSGLSKLPYFNRLDTGLEKLDHFSTHEIKNTYLNRNDKGYIPIYRLLSTIAPYTLPPLKETLALSGSRSEAQLIGVKSGTKRRATAEGIQSKKAMETIYICFRTQEDIAEPLCELRDLMFIVRDFKTRWCSRFGFFFAFLALLLGEGISLRNSIKFRLNQKYSKANNEEKQLNQSEERDSQH